MGRRKKGLLSEVGESIKLTLGPMTSGWKRLLPLAFLALLLILFGVASAMMIAIALLGLFLIFKIVKTNSEWIERESKSKSKSKSKR